MCSGSCFKSIPIAFVVPQNAAMNILDDVASFCEFNFPEHSRPKAIHVVDQIPHKITGKVDYQYLEKIAVGKNRV